MYQVLAVVFLFCSFVSSCVFGAVEATVDDAPPYVIILYGAPGSGRATMAIRLRRDFAFPTISLATLLTTHVLEGTTLGTKGRDYYINGGELPQELLPEIVCDRLLKPDCSKGAFLEDISLSTSQILNIQQQLSSRFRFLVLNIDASDDYLIQRVERRLVCSSCGYVYDDPESSRKRRTACDVCSSPLHRRQEDSPEVIKARLETYRNQISPLLKLYKEQGILVQIPGNRPIVEMYKDLLQTIEHITGLVASKKHLNEPEFSDYSHLG